MGDSSSSLAGVTSPSEVLSLLASVVGSPSEVALDLLSVMTVMSSSSVLATVLVVARLLVFRLGINGACRSNEFLLRFKHLRIAAPTRQA